MSRSIASIQKECARHAQNTGRKTYAVDVGADGLLCPIFVTAGRIERGEVIICEAEAPAGYGKHRGGVRDGSVIGRVAQYLKEVQSAKCSEMQKALGVSGKALDSCLHRRTDLFERIDKGVYRLRGELNRVWPANRTALIPVQAKAAKDKPAVASKKRASVLPFIVELLKLNHGLRREQIRLRLASSGMDFSKKQIDNAIHTNREKFVRGVHCVWSLAEPAGSDVGRQDGPEAKAA
jgi:hypothetical protein